MSLGKYVKGVCVVQLGGCCLTCHSHPSLPPPTGEEKAEQQTEMWERIKDKRAQSCHAGIYINSIKKWIHSDLDSRQQYTFLRTLDKLPEDLVWKTLDNSFVPMTRALLDELSLKLIADEQHDFQNAERHKAAMLKAENPLEYDYSSGWSAADLMNKEVQCNMDNRVVLALYKGNRSGKWYSPSVLQARLGDWLIRKFTRSPYSHCEIAVVVSNGQYDCYSASLRDGGVRRKTMPLPADKWDLIPINQLDAYIDVLNYFAQTRGKPYDFVGACGVVLGIKGSLKKWFCSEWCAAALGLQYPDRYSPQELANWLGQPNKSQEILNSRLKSYFSTVENKHGKQ